MHEDNDVGCKDFFLNGLKKGDEWVLCIRSEVLKRI